jgi:HAD domain in Swiss Army Knife RNA repair proteins
MKVIFLDIDGVLNSHVFLEDLQKRTSGKLFTIDDTQSWEEMIDPVCVARLERLVTASEAKVVISSSWRHAHDWMKMRALLHRRGFTGEVISQTPAKLSLDHRGAEIQMWLDDFKEEPVESFVILDDTTDMEPFMERLVRTSLYTGLADEDVLIACKLLNTPFEKKKRTLRMPKMPRKFR